MKNIYRETKSVIRQRELVPDFFIEFFNLVFFYESKSIGRPKPKYEEAAEAYAQIYKKSKSKKLFHFFLQSFEKNKSHKTKRTTGSRA